MPEVHVGEDWVVDTFGDGFIFGPKEFLSEQGAFAYDVEEEEFVSYGFFKLAER